MGSRLGGRVVNFANLPIKLLMPSSFTNITEIALKTIPSASKIEIKRVLESLYGFDVEKVRTLNMEGKKKKRGGLLIAKPDYKKAYVTLRNPLSISPDLYPLRIIEEEKKRVNKPSKSSVVEEGETKRHWLDQKEGASFKLEKASNDRRPSRAEGVAKFPWSSMRQVFSEDGDAKSREFGVMFIQTSAKAGFNIKPLFRKIATSLPGMESLSPAKQEDMVDVNLKPTANSSQTEQQGGGCAC